MAGIGYRKNIDCLSTEELHSLREALAAMYLVPASNPNSFAFQATFHGGPPISYCRHGAPGFFTWHRAELKAFEDALQSIDCDVMLPYWDWSSGPSTGVPAACHDATYVNRIGATVPNPLFAGPRNGGGMTVRGGSIDTTAFDDLASGVQTSMTEPSFASFQSLINGPHGSVHGRVGGDMCCVPTASYDPIFFLHHANVDRIWARWQILHPGPLPADEASWELPPFNRPFSTQWQTGSDVESTDALGYRYRTLCFFLPPFRIWDVVVFRWPPEIRTRFERARLVVKSTRMQEQAIDVRVFLNQPKATARTKTIGNPAYAGGFGFMGHGGAADVDAAHCPECARLGHVHDHAAHASAPAGHDHADHDHDEHDDADHDHGHATPSTDERFDVEFDLGTALRAIEGDEDVTIKLVAVDVDGNEVAVDDFLVDEIALDVD
jgi:hypothetical protein